MSIFERTVHALQSEIALESIASIFARIDSSDSSGNDFCIYHRFLINKPIL
jgi:hypothetical protein